jgi:hypothetical protein
MPNQPQQGTTLFSRLQHSLQICIDQVEMNLGFFTASMGSLDRFNSQ